MAQEIAKLKEEGNISSPGTMSPGARNSRIFALENMLATSSSTLVSMASQLSEAEERERVFSGRGRWNQVRSLAEAKNSMNYLFNIASTSRCMVRDREIDCREKDAEIKDLKEKVVKLSSLARQLEKENAELMHQIQQARNNTVNNSWFTNENGQGRMYDLRQGLRSPGFSKYGSNSLELLEDMDTSESDHGDSGDESGDDEWVHPMFIVDKRNRKGGLSGSESHSDSKDGEGLNRQDSVDTVDSGQEQSKHAACCSCSKQSCCTTAKCECHASLVICSESCGCSSEKCSNREAQQIEEADDMVQQGAALLHSALAEMPVEKQEEIGTRRTPLADIGNTDAKSNAPRPSERKKWRKSTIQLVPAALHLPQSENVEPPKQPESSAADPNIPLRLPRAMRSASSSNNLLRDRNSEQEEAPSVNKEPGDRAQRSPARKPNKSEEKENYGLYPKTKRH
ncbi:hypothetical protein Cgig2_033645 [Carnegiea gigantea]|uniref:Tesmin/TSO1-like CXC domain-containing protein n=1 Tax=Carnegiea gigantea TaxID=171969 RepID=A0A9Q1JIN9_9CARY|nr:hypothetical protein Cgig2_033645 [Carnegiea gigantea]